MSLLAHFSDRAGETHEAGAVAAAETAAAFGRWVDGLPAAGHEDLKRLREGGFAYDLAALEGQLRRALSRPGAPAAVRTAGLRLLRILSGRGDAVCLLVEDTAVPAHV
jgi:uncharacterized protein (DUF1501 family)